MDNRTSCRHHTLLRAVAPQGSRTPFLFLFSKACHAPHLFFWELLCTVGRSSHFWLLIYFISTFKLFRPCCVVNTIIYSDMRLFKTFNFGVRALLSRIWIETAPTIHWSNESSLGYGMSATVVRVLFATRILISQIFLAHEATGLTSSHKVRNCFLTHIMLFYLLVLV